MVSPAEHFLVYEAIQTTSGTLCGGSTWFMMVGEQKQKNIPHAIINKDE